MRFLFFVSLTILVFAIESSSALAQNVEPIGVSGKWHAYTFLEDGKKVCYMSSEPEKKEGDYKVRGPVYALVTHRPALNSRDVVSLISGYPLKPDADIVVTIDRKQKFALFADKETAWAPDEKTDHELVKAMIKGTSMIVEGISSRGNKTKDTYSLTGFGKIYQTMSQACGVKG